MIISLLIVVESKGGVFFIQDRIGEGGKPFRMVKFRTMCKDAHLKGNAITAKNDFRITRIGNFLRDYKIDELPNLINVFLGQMSIVGPRPEVPDYKSEFSGEMEELLEIKPGITGPSQLFYFYEFNIVPTKNVTPEFYRYHLKNKMRLDLDYKRNRTILSDLKLIFLTVLRMFFKEDGLNKREKAEVNEGEDTGEDDKVYSKVKTRSHLTA
jgi:lipopolysaccharide/colanic/teichoic acid biosynthesis glycosyltransferase